MLKEYYAQKEELIKEGKAHVEAGVQEKADEILAQVEELNKKIKAEIMFLDDEEARSDTARAAALATAEAINNGHVLAESLGSTGNIDTEEDEKDPTASTEYLNAFIDDMRRVATPKQTALLEEVNASTHTTETTEILIPTTLARGIWKRVEELFPMWADAPKTRVKGRLTYQKKKGSTDTKTWYDDTESGKNRKAVETTEFKFGELTLDGCEISKSVEVSFKMHAMSRAEFIPFIESELANKLGVALSNAVWEGAGVRENHPPQPLGIITELNKNGTDQISNYTTLEYKDLTTLMKKLHSPYRSGSTIYANDATVWDELANIVDKNGRPILIHDVTGQTIGRIFGRVVKEAAELPDGVIMLANFTEGLRYNINQDITVYNDVVAKQRFTRHTLYGIADGGVVDTKAFSILKKGGATPTTQKAEK